MIFVELTHEDNFQSPYYLFIPKNTIQNEKVHVLIEPNKTGFLDNDLQKHIDKAKTTAPNDFYSGSYEGQKLKYPILVPVFPRSKSTSKIYTHSLDKNVAVKIEMFKLGQPL